MFIKEAIPSIIKDSRNKKTIQIELYTFEGKFKSSAPSGKSRGKSEVDPYNSKGIEKSLSLLKLFCKKIQDTNFKIKKIDDLKSLVEKVKRFESKYGRLGGNCTYALESVFLKAAAADNNCEVWELIHKDMYPGKKPKMPMPVGNCIGGGLHSEFVRGKRPDFQEFLLIPKEKSFCHAVTINLKAYYKAKSILKSRRINDENAVETFKTNEEVLEVLSKIAKQYKLRIGLDIAASSFFEKGYYKYKNKELIRDKVDQTDYIKNLIKKFNIFYVEDPMQEEDFSGFKEILNYTKDNNLKTLVVGDDLVTTNMRLTMRAVGSDSINAMIIKPNQIGSLIEVKKVVEFCNKHNIAKIFSHRDGETSDNILADYCIGFEGDFIKTGIYGRERLIKLKRIIDIEKTLNRF